MNKYEKKELKKEKVKNIVKWSAIGLGYSLLLCAFVGLVALGVKGCNNKTNKNESVKAKVAQNVLPYKHVEGNYMTAGKYYVQSLNFSTYWDDYSLPDYPQLEHTERKFVTGNINGQVFNQIYTKFFVSGDWDENEGTGWITTAFYLINDGNNVAGYETRLTTSGGQITTNTLNIGDIVVFDSAVSIENTNGILYETFAYFATYKGFDFVFNDLINPFAPIGMNNDYFQYGSYNGTYSVATGLFKTTDDGTLYNEIRITYMSAAASRYGTATSYNTAPSNTYQYAGLFYVRVSDNVSVLVNQAKSIIATGGNQAGQYVLTNENYWISNTYKRLQVYSLRNSNALPAKQLNNISLLNAFNNLVNYNGSIDINTDIGGNPLNLIGNAFVSLTSFFGITILPGVTLGVLLFLPLVAGIVLAIVKVVRK